MEDVGKYKPHAEVYRWAAGRVGADVSDCLLVAAHGWDVAGAKWAGMQTAFVARPGQQTFPLGPMPDINIPSLAELAGELEAPVAGAASIRSARPVRSQLLLDHCLQRLPVLQAGQHPVADHEHRHPAHAGLFIGVARRATL